MECHSWSIQVVLAKVEIRIEELKFKVMKIRTMSNIEENTCHYLNTKLYYIQSCICTGTCTCNSTIVLTSAYFRYIQPSLRAREEGKQHK